MPVIPAMTLASPTVDPDEIYSDGLYAPANPATSLEILNGGMDEANYGGGDNTIPAHACQIGSFAVGYYFGFNRWEAVYGRQTSEADNAVKDPERRVMHAGLSYDLFLPWDAKMAIFGFQGHFQHDATNWNTDDVATPEFWDLQVNFDGQRFDSLHTVLPSTRSSTDTPDSTDGSYSDPGDSLESRFRYVSVIGAKKDVIKGYRKLRMSMWGRIFSDDSKKAKAITLSGGAWMLCIR